MKASQGHLTISISLHLKAQLGFLASDWTEGREAGTKGEYLAADYIASLLQLSGVKPGGDVPGGKNSTGDFTDPGRTWFQNFVLIKTSPGEENEMKIRKTDGKSIITISLTADIDFRTRNPFQSLEIEAPIVFVGYGIRNEKLRADDFSKMDLKGKFVLRITGAPGIAKSRLSLSELSNISRDS